MFHTQGQIACEWTDSSHLVRTETESEETPPSTLPLLWLQQIPQETLSCPAGSLGSRLLSPPGRVHVAPLQPSLGCFCLAALTVARGTLRDFLSSWPQEASPWHLLPLCPVGTEVTTCSLDLSTFSTPAFHSRSPGCPAPLPSTPAPRHTLRAPAVPKVPNPHTSDGQVATTQAQATETAAVASELPRDLCSNSSVFSKDEGYVRPHCSQLETPPRTFIPVPLPTPVQKCLPGMGISAQGLCTG